MDKIRKRHKKLRELFEKELGPDIDTKSEEIWKRKLKLMKGLYKGRRGIIITCGPSLNLYEKDIQWFVDNDFVVVCVKQAILKMPEQLCDIHVGNFCNEQRYSFDKDVGPISVYCQKNVKKVKKELGMGGINDYDVYVTHYSHNDYDNILTGIQNNKDEISCEKWMSRKVFAVKWGDTMHELAIPICINLGLKEVYVIGWDCNNFVKHFYGKSDSNEIKQHKINPLRKKLNKQHIRWSNKLSPFLKRHFGLELKLVGNHSALKIPKVAMDTIKSKTE